MARPTAFNKTATTERKAINSILKVWGHATGEQISAGHTWYRDAFVLATKVSEIADISLERAACVIAALSPRTTWERNVVAALAIANGEPVPATLPANVARANLAMTAADPWSIFTPHSRKILNFTKNILGDESAVTVDMWASRIAGITEIELARAGVYEAVAHAYTRAAAHRGVSPAVMQATTWIIVRATKRPQTKVVEYV
ncbi:DUF7178 family protein [Nocardia sp. CA-119907]|uniref:DUF7178 family protein n=1 Tax=Nocardia sp. CA-119907 TaxID=3239973 RepID=UPI003D970196